MLHSWKLREVTASRTKGARHLVEKIGLHWEVALKAASRIKIALARCERILIAACIGEPLVYLRRTEGLISVLRASSHSNS